MGERKARSGDRRTGEKRHEVLDARLTRNEHKTEKRDDAATLRALGADTSFLRRLFSAEGALISGAGALLGVVLGVGATLLQQHYGLIRIPAESFLMQSYPVEFRWTDLAAVAVAFTLVAGLITHLTVRSMIQRTEP